MRRASQPWRVYTLGIVLITVVVIAAGAVAIWRSRVSAGKSQRASNPAANAPSVLVASAMLGPPERELDVQGEARPMASVTLYSKISGYLRAIYVDRGDRVQENQVLAVIQSPEIDRQHQAASADAEFKRANAQSAAQLSGGGAISARQVESERASAAVAEAVLAGLKTQKAFTILRAPFEGTVTARFADPGALVQNAANAQSGALPVVTISQTDRVRVFTYVDQRNARWVQVGDPVQLTIPETGTVQPGRVTRINGELDPRTRMMVIEVRPDAQDRSILPGAFVRARMTVKTPGLVDVPAEALLWREQKPFVAVVTGNNRLKLRPVVLGHFKGALAGLSAGVTPGERVALNLGRAAADDDLIEPVPFKPPTKDARRR